MNAPLLDNINRILVINLGGVGDLILSSPALRALKKAYPGAHLTVLAVPRVTEYVRSLTCVDETAVFHQGTAGIMRNLWMLSKLRLSHFDLAVNMRTMASSRGARQMEFLMRLIKPRIKAGRNTAGRGTFFNISIPESLAGDKCEMEYDIDTVGALGAAVEDRSIHLQCPERARGKIESLLNLRVPLRQGILVGIHPGGRPASRWPLENFAQVIRQIDALINCTFVITGSRQEKGITQRLAGSVDARIVNLAGKTGFQELVCLINACSLFVTNDTGPMHIAAVLKVPLVAVFGPGFITRFNPCHISQSATALYKKCSCSPCNKVSCDDMRCLTAVTAEDVIKAAFQLLEGARLINR